MQQKIQVALKSGELAKRALHQVGASVLYRTPASWRKRAFQGEQHVCPICESEVSAFLPISRPYHAYCPVCQSLQRHRMVWLFMQQRGIISGQAQHFLHIAPEPALARQFMKMSSLTYLSADLFDKNAMVQMDICNIQYPDASFDIIYCSHVLEHVPDDRKALSEFRRVLKPDGVAIILVPITAAETFEDPSITDPSERERVFGQHDHVRVYGPDFAERLTDAGFDVEIVESAQLANSNDLVRFGLPTKESIYFCKNQ